MALSGQAAGQAIERAASGARADAVIDFRLGVGKKVPLDISVLPYPGSDGSTLFFCGRELSRQSANVSASSGENEQLLNAAENAEIGLWYWDFKTDKIHSTRQCNELLGLPSYDALTLENVLSVIHSDDRFLVSNFLNESRNRGTKYEEEFRVVTPDGAALPDAVWISIVARPIHRCSTFIVTWMSWIRR